MKASIRRIAFLVLLGSASPAISEPIKFTFEGTVSEGALDEELLNGQTFLAIGTVLDEVDVGSFSCCGIFVAESTVFEFSSGETFVADRRSTYFTQQFSIVFGEGPTILNSLNGNPDFTNGIFGSGNAPVKFYSDSHVPEAIGRVSYTTTGVGNGPEFKLQNEAGATLSMTRATFRRLTTEPIPEPSTGMSAMLGLLALTRLRRTSRLAA